MAGQGKKLTAKQIRFVEEYLVDLNGTQAALRSGYSPKTANRIASENLSKPDIQRAIQEKQKILSENTGINQEKVLGELAKIAFDGKTTNFTGANKIAALELLAKYLGLFAEDNRQRSGVPNLTWTAEDKELLTKLADRRENEIIREHRRDIEREARAK